jgi:hypothetical protein
LEYGWANVKFAINRNRVLTYGTTGIHLRKERGEVMDKKDFDSWKSVIEEVKRYLDQNVDSFTVSSGPWTIEYDNRKENEVKE